MKLRITLFLLVATVAAGLQAQIKIGDNPQNLNPASILELESTDRAFVINRVTTVQMNAIIPLEGAMVYNTDIQCLHYYDGENWLNLCEALGLNITNEAIKHPDTTIFITRTDNTINIEVDSITGLQIVDRSIRREDIALATITNGNIQNATIQNTKIAPGPNNTQLVTNNGGLVVWAPRTSPIAFGKVIGSDLQSNSFGISSITPVGVGYYQVNLTAPRPTDNYTIQLTVSGDNRINVDFQANNSFFVEIKEYNSGVFIGTATWYITVFDF